MTDTGYFDGASTNLKASVRAQAKGISIAIPFSQISTV